MKGEDYLVHRFTMEPNSKDIDHGDFWEDMLRGHAPDEMVLQLDRPAGEPPESTFSMEAVNEIAEQFRLFLMARIIAHKNRTGRQPKHLRAHVNLDWAPRLDPHNDPNVGPYFQIERDTGKTPLDSEHREYTWRTKP